MKSCFIKQLSFLEKGCLLRMQVLQNFTYKHIFVAGYLPFSMTNCSRKPTVNVFVNCCCCNFCSLNGGIGVYVCLVFEVILVIKYFLLLSKKFLKQTTQCMQN